MVHSSMRRHGKTKDKNAPVNGAIAHERDETADPNSGPPRPIMRQAASDLAQGLVDTDLHGQRGIEQAVTPHQGKQAKPLPEQDAEMRHGPDSVKNRNDQ